MLFPRVVTQQHIRWLAMSLITLLLSGCALGRMYEVKQQFCNFDDNFSWSLSAQPEFVFGQPVILDVDVERLMGFGPSEVIAGNDGLVHRYVLEKITGDDTPGETYSLALHYVAHDSENRLQSIQLPAELADVGDMEALADPEAIAMAAGRVCSAGLSQVFGTMEEDIDPRHLEHLPDKEQLLAMAGRPSRESAEERALVYEYQLAGVDAAEPVLSLAVWFDEAGVKPVRMESRRGEMLSKADFQRRKVSFSYGD